VRKPAPAASCTNKKVHELQSPQVGPFTGIPCAMVLRLTPRSLRRSGLLSPSLATMLKHCRQLRASVEALRPRGFGIRVRRIRLVRRPRPSHPAPNTRDDRPSAPLYRARDARRGASDLPDIASESACDTMARRANQVTARKSSAQNCQALIVMARAGDSDSSASFRGASKRRAMVRNCAPENLEIPGLALTHHPGMTGGPACWGWRSQ
jgi:hypothetical protein